MKGTDSKESPDLGKVVLNKYKYVEKWESIILLE